MLRHHLKTKDSPLRYITTDMIDMPDYGGGVKYSLFEQNVAIAQWFRDTWKTMLTAQSRPSYRDAELER